MKLKKWIIKSLLLVILISSNSFCDEAKVDTSKPAPIDEIINVPLENDWYINNRKFQEKVNEALIERDTCLKYYTDSASFPIFETSIGLTVSIGLGIGLGFLFFGN